MTERSSTELTEEIKASVRANIEKIRHDVAGADVTVMAATKTVPAEIINYAVRECGLGNIGENRVQELRDKYDMLALDKANLHFIGTLQPNKVKYIVGKVCLIHSLDSVKLAEEISRRSLAAGLVTDTLCEINIGGENAKGGISQSDAEDFIRRCGSFDGMRIRGLMVIGPHCDDVNGYRPYFADTKALFDKLNAKGLLSDQPILSMGMSDNYKLAVEYGATLIRPGTAIFGKRT